MTVPYTPPSGGVFAFGREDRVPLAAIVMLPLLIALPQLLGYFQADPLFYRANVAYDVVRGILPGVPYIDPNDGFQTQALGFRAAKDLIRGIMPWWNPYTGVGLPLAGEYQPAAFFPLTLLLLLPKGMLLQHLLLQILAGVGTYGLLRHTGIARTAATVGGLLYAFNGTLGWYAHGPAQPVPFLPWMLWGIERAQAKALLGYPGGWRMLAASMAMGLLAGFPETAYISGLFALVWAIVRGFQLPTVARAAFARLVAVGGSVGVLVTTPQVWAFFHYLTLADTFGHESMAHAVLHPAAIVTSLIAPYLHGPVFAIFDRPAIFGSWGMGGFTTLAVVTVAVYGLLVRRGPMAWTLAAWTLLALLKTFGVSTVSSLWNFIPGISVTAFGRYAPPSWELALVVLCAWGLDDLLRNRAPNRLALLVACAVPVAAVAAIVLCSGHLMPDIASPVTKRQVHMRNWAFGAAAWAFVTCAACLVSIAQARLEGARRALAILLVVDAVLMFAIPTLSNPRGGKVDTASIRFLRDNLELQRIFAIEAFQPNYGAYFGLAAINHNYLPLERKWLAFVRKRLDTLNNTEWFNGDRHGGEKPSGQQLGENIEWYRWVGVKYVVASPRMIVGLPVAHKGEAMTIYELPGHAPYFEALGAKCRIDEAKRTSATVTCDAPAQLVRRELFFPGWSATVGGKEVEIAEHGELFQQIALPFGKSEVRFSYAPPHIGWAWLASALGAAALFAPLGSRLRRRFFR
jgi:hypothetical protein